MKQIYISWILRTIKILIQESKTDFSTKSSSTKAKVTIETSVEEIKQIVTEKDQFEHQEKSINRTLSRISIPTRFSGKEQNKKSLNQILLKISIAFD